MKTPQKDKSNAPHAGKGILKSAKPKPSQPPARKTLAQVLLSIGANSSAAGAQKKTVRFDETPVALETGEPYTRPPRPHGNFRRSKIPVRTVSKAICFRPPMSSRRRRVYPQKIADDERHNK